MTDISALPLPPDADAPDEVIWQGRFITTRKRGRWEYVSRARASAPP